MITLVCRHCRQQFNQWPSNNRQYCSRACSAESRRVARIACTCITCGVTFMRRPRDVQRNRDRFCTRGCYMASKRIIADAGGRAAYYRQWKERNRASLRARNHERWLKQRDELRQQRRDYYLAHRTAIKAAARFYYVTHREACKARVARWVASHPNRRRSRTRQRERRAAYTVLHRAEKREYDLVRSISSRLNRSVDLATAIEVREERLWLVRAKKELRAVRRWLKEQKIRHRAALPSQPVA